MDSKTNRKLKIAGIVIATILALVFWKVTALIIATAAAVAVCVIVIKSIRRRREARRIEERRLEEQRRAEKAKIERDLARRKQEELDRQIEEKRLEGIRKAAEEAAREKKRAERERLAELKRRHDEEVARRRKAHKDKLIMARLSRDAAIQFDALCEERKGLLRDLLAKFGFKTFQREWLCRVEHKADNHLESPYGKIRTRLHIAHRITVLEVVFLPDGKCASVRFGQSFQKNIAWDAGLSFLSENIDRVSPLKRKQSSALIAPSPAK